MAAFKELDHELRSLGFMPGAPMRRLAVADYRRAHERDCPDCGHHGLQYIPYVMSAEFGIDFGGGGGYRKVFRCPECLGAFEP